MKIGIIGAGKVGTSLGKYLRENGAEVSGFCSKTRQSAADAAEFTDTTCFDEQEDLISASDTIFITTPDGEIKRAWDRIAKYDIRGKIVCHFSGSLSSEVFSDIRLTGAHGCSFHPIYAFSDRFSSYKKFDTARITAEGDPEAVILLRALFEGCGNKVMTVASSEKTRYHAATVFASNMVVGLLRSSVDLLNSCGFSDEDAYSIIGPLTKNNVDSVFSRGCAESLTGPVERNDIQTVASHIADLSRSAGTEAELAIYKDIKSKLVELARQKNPDRDYTQMEEL